MKKNLCFIVVSILLAMSSNAQNITINSKAILDSIRSAGKKVKILYVPPPKEQPKPKEFYSIQLGARSAKIKTSNTPLDNNLFGEAVDVYHIVNEEGIYIYLSGEFNKLNDAIIEKNKLSKKGQNSIYVVKVIDRRKVVLIKRKVVVEEHIL